MKDRTLKQHVRAMSDSARLPDDDLARLRSRLEEEAGAMGVTLLDSGGKEAAAAGLFWTARKKLLTAALAAAGLGLAFLKSFGPLPGGANYRLPGVLFEQYKRRSDAEFLLRDAETLARKASVEGFRVDLRPATWLRSEVFMVGGRLESLAGAWGVQIRYRTPQGDRIDVFEFPDPGKYTVGTSPETARYQAFGEVGVFLWAADERLYAMVGERLVRSQDGSGWLVEGGKPSLRDTDGPELAAFDPEVKQPKILVLPKAKLAFFEDGRPALEEYDRVRESVEGRAAIRQANLWGFADAGTGDVVVPVRFQQVRNYREGLAAVKLEGLWGVVDHSGRFVLEPTYPRDGLVGDYHQGRARVWVDDRLGYLGRHGELAIPAIYDEGRDFQDGHAAVRIEGRWGFIDRGGNPVVRPRFERVGNFSEGLAPALRLDHWGYVDSTGAWKIPPRFPDQGRVRPTSFRNGRARIDTGDGFAYIDTRGEIVIPGPFSRTQEFRDGVAAVLFPGPAESWTLIDVHGNELAPRSEVFYRVWKNGLPGRRRLREEGTGTRVTDRRGKLIYREDVYLWPTTYRPGGVVEDWIFGELSIPEEKLLRPGFFHRSGVFVAPGMRRELTPRSDE